MTDEYADIRAALDAGPTPGPWTVRYDYVVQAPSFDGGRLVPVAQPYGVNSDGTDLFANARMIAACHPEVIRALLAERDALLDQHHRDSKELRILCAQRDAARKVSKEAGAVIAALKAERDALRVALEDELIWHEAQDKAISKQPNAYTGHNWGRWIQHQEHAAVIRAALGQSQEEV